MDTARFNSKFLKKQNKQANPTKDYKNFSWISLLKYPNCDIP